MVGTHALVAPVSAGPATAPPPGTAPDRHLARVARGGFFTLAGSLVSAVATFLFTVVVTRSLGQGEAGIFFSLTSAFVVAYSLSRLGAPTGLVYFLARYRATGEQRRLRAVTRQAVTVVSVLSAAVGTAGVVLAPRIAPALTGSTDGSTVLLVRVLALAVVFAALNDVGVGTTRGLGATRPLVLVERVGRPLCQLALAAGVVLAGQDTALGVGVAWVLPFVVGSAVLAAWARRLRSAIEHRHDVARDHGGARAEVGPFWRFSAPRSITAVSQVVLQRADIVLLGVYAGPAEAAVYAAATRFLVFGQLGAGAISSAIQPKLAALLSRGETADARAIYRVATVWLVLLAWPVYLLSAVFAPQLLLVFGEGYRVGAVVIVVLSLTMLVATACGAVDVVLVMAGRTTWTMGNSLLALAVNLGLNVLLIPQLGIAGAAIAWAAAILVNNLLPLTQLAVSLGLHPFGRSSLAAVGLATACFGLLPLLARALSSSDVLVPALAAAAGAALYLLAAWRLRDLLALDALVAVRRGRR